MISREFSVLFKFSNRENVLNFKCIRVIARNNAEQTPIVREMKSVVTTDVVRSVYVRNYLQPQRQHLRQLHHCKKKVSYLKPTALTIIVKQYLSICFLRVPTESPPEIVTSDGNVESEEGNFATLKCVVIGKPIPTIVWQRNTTLVIIIEQYG